MMMMTLMKLVNSATKFRHGIDKFYQTNSGLRSSRTWDEATYTCTYTYTYSCTYTYTCTYTYAYTYTRNHTHIRRPRQTQGGARQGIRHLTLVGRRRLLLLLVLLVLVLLLRQQLTAGAGQQEGHV